MREGWGGFWAKRFDFWHNLSLAGFVGGVIAALFLSWFVSVAQASQPPVCAPRDKMTAFLADKYKEKPISFMLVNDKAYLEVFVSEAGTWTIISYNVKNIGCPLAAGVGYTEYPVEEETY